MDLVALARVRRPQGLRGELRVELMTDFPEHIMQLKEAILRVPGGRQERVELESVRMVRDGAVLKTSGAGTIEEAEGWVGAELMVPEDEVWPLLPDHYYHFDLVGCEVIRAEGEVVGTVVGVRDAGSTWLEVEAAGTGREILVPFCQPICFRIDPDRKQIWIAPPEGLLELNA
ncbi:MAG: 16S rRNA processing protein RimM [Acidobacteria bacterium]|nr:16S rRNA processing protein RimM [Acidobacteriota bacterium]